MGGGVMSKRMVVWEMKVYSATGYVELLARTCGNLCDGTDCDGHQWVIPITYEGLEKFEEAAVLMRTHPSWKRTDLDLCADYQGRKVSAVLRRNDNDLSLGIIVQDPDGRRRRAHSLKDTEWVHALLETKHEMDRQRRALALEEIFPPI